MLQACVAMQSISEPNNSRNGSPFDRRAISCLATISKIAKARQATIVGEPHPSFRASTTSVGISSRCALDCHGLTASQ